MDRMKNNNSGRGSRVKSTIILIHPAENLKTNFVTFHSVTNDTYKLLCLNILCLIQCSKIGMIFFCDGSFLYRGFLIY